MKCKYEQRRKDYIYCNRTGSIRKRGCPCPHYTPSSWGKLWSKFKMWLGI